MVQELYTVKSLGENATKIYEVLMTGQCLNSAARKLQAMHNSAVDAKYVFKDSTSPELTYSKCPTLIAAKALHSVAVGNAIQTFTGIEARRAA